ncbi:MAG TPA: elongation factor G [Candidatus Omnitrophota bacterium]|nr:elongation factor G [Candidatus Omnitrophota bacterium]
MDVKNKRTVVLVGHAHCGKTSLTESLLYVSGATSRKGDVMQGSSLSDYNEDERERQCSINSSFLETTYKNHKIQFIDTPGYMDFIGETVAAIRVADAAIVLIDAVNGVEVGTEDIWAKLTELKVPRVIFINKTDKPEAHVPETIQAIQQELSKDAHVVDFGSADLVESIAETDDALLEKYLETGALASEEMNKAFRKAILEAKIFPILKGSALTDDGVKTLLDEIIDYFPSPVDHPDFVALDPSTKEARAIKPTEDGPFAGFVFKSIFDAHLGHLSLVRILRGAINSNAEFYNVNTHNKERISTISILQGKEQKAVEKASCGDIIALPKLKYTHVCDSLTDLKEQVLISPIDFPEPSISASIKPKTRADEEKISNSLHQLCEEDHTFRANRDAETNELIVSGIGDLHLKVMLDRMKRRYHVDVDMGTPKVSYREAITRKASARYKYKKQSGGRGQYGDVALEVAPLPHNGPMYEFVNKIFGGAIPRNFIPSIEKGVVKAISEGALAGYHIDYIQVTVVDGSYHDVDSSDMAFQIAGSLAMKEALKQAGLVLLEPIMDVSITVPDEFIGQISGDISSRRGRIMTTEVKIKKQVIKAQIPLSQMFKYATDLRSMTAGRGSYTMKMSHYEQAPAKVTEEVIAASKKDKEHSS